MLTIRQAQFAVLSQLEVQKFEEWMLVHLKRFFPRQCAGGGDQRLREMVQYGIQRAAGYGVTAKRDVCKYIDLMIVFGRDFDTDVSIVLPAYNEGPRLCQTLAAIRDTTSVSYEVIVVNDASTDSCCDVLRADPPPFENLVLVDLPRRHGVAHARNLGAELARAPSWSPWTRTASLAPDGWRSFWRNFTNLVSASSLRRSAASNVPRPPHSV
jgi:hypothetical protein